MPTLTFKPKILAKKLLLDLPKRAQDVITKRFGLAGEGERMTLEAIGDTYGITRERVRQIENFALTTIRKSKAFQEETTAFEELKNLMRTMGSIVPERDFLESISTDVVTQNHIHFFLVLGHFFVKQKEDDYFHHRWHIDKEVSEQVHGAIKKLYSTLTMDDLIEESKMIDRFLENLKDVNEEYRDKEILRRWLALSKQISSNPMGEWGMADSPNVSARGMRDYAFLVLRKHGSPMHFTEVAKAIGKHFDRKAHIATTHNELIKDERFVLVGRGLYALKEWGYASGVVRDVITKILEKNGALTKEEIIDKVLRERYVKPNTIVVNLQNPKQFRKDPSGKYSLV